MEIKSHAHEFRATERCECGSKGVPGGQGLSNDPPTKTQIISRLYDTKTLKPMAHFKLSGIESISATQTFQDGGGPGVKRSMSKRRLACKDRLEGCLRSGLHQSTVKRFLSFKNQGTVYQYKILVFGLSIALRIFSKLMRYALEPLRKKGFRFIYYLDNVCILERSKEKLPEVTKVITQHLSNLVVYDQLEEKHTDTESNTGLSRFHFFAEEV